MTLQVIYTLLQGGQEIANFEFNPEDIATKESFIDFCKRALKLKYAFADSVESYMSNPKEKEIPKITKLSGCIYLEGGIYDNEPEWWKQASGKVYF